MSYNPPNITTPHHLTHFLNGTWTRHLTSMSLVSPNIKQNAFQFERSINSVIRINANGNKMSWGFGSQSLSEDSFAYQMQVTNFSSNGNTQGNNQGNQSHSNSIQDLNDDSDTDSVSSQNASGVLQINWIYQGQTCSGFYDNNLKIMQLTFHVHRVGTSNSQKNSSLASFISVTYKFVSESIANITMVEVDEKGKNSLLYGVMLKSNE